MYPEKKGGSHKMARPQQNWGLLTLLTRWASIWTMPNTASPKSEPPCGRAVYAPVRATILGHPPQKTAPGGMVEIRRSWNHLISTMGFPILVRWHLYSYIRVLMSTKKCNRLTVHPLPHHSLVTDLPSFENCLLHYFSHHGLACLPSGCQSSLPQMVILDKL